MAEQAVRDLPPSNRSVISANIKKWAIYRMMEVRADLTGIPVGSLGDPS